MRSLTRYALLGGLCCLTMLTRGEPAFEIRVVDEATSRGIPMVTLETMLNTRHVTDSAGRVAFDEPLAMNQDVFFRPISDGYRFDTPDLAMGGTVFHTSPGSSGTIVMQRDMLAERLYRITGAGLYRDSIKLGHKAPITEPLLNTGVVGQDSALCSIYRGKLFWIWGDTSWMRHPLGNFGATGATSDLPTSGGLPIDTGINLHYFAREDSRFVKPMMPRQPGDESGVYWMSCLMTVPDADGHEHLMALVDNIEGPSMKSLSRRLIEFDPQEKQFRVLMQLPENAIQPKGHAVRADMQADNGTTTSYYIFTGSEEQTRVLATYENVINPAAYEALTCLENNSEFTTASAKIIRDAEGRAQFVWRKNAAPVSAKQQRELVDAGLLKPDECLFRPIDANTGEPVIPHGCTIAWNAYRNCWTMIMSQMAGTSLLGELWYLEAPSPTGPWHKAIKVVTHDDYTIYNPLQHPELTPPGSKYLYFEGTYTKMFSGAKTATAWYDYNQVMFRLELDDPRLHHALD